MKIGDKFYSPPKNADPWGVNKPLTVTVMDLKDGWVKYQLESIPGADYVLQEEDFRRVYPNRHEQ